MRILSLALLLLLDVTASAQQKAKLVFFEHSLRWASENNFPDYLSDDSTRSVIEHAVLERLEKHLSMPVDHKPIQYRTIDGFGKAKIDWPKKSSASKEVALMSAISRDVTGFGITWSLLIQTRDSGKPGIEKKVSHELEPLSYSGYMSAQRWIEEDEFTDLFLRLIDEALGLGEALPPVVKVGSMDRVVAKIQDIIPMADKHSLTVAGAMLEESNATYELRHDDNLLTHIKYRQGFSTSAPRNLFARSLFNGILKEITGLETYYAFEARESRVAKLISDDGSEKKLRIDWLTETHQQSELLGETTVERVVSPITGQLFWKDSLYAHFVYYKRLNGKPVRLKNFSPSAPYHHIHNVEGVYRGKKLDVVYPEQEGIVIIYLDDEPAAVLSMFNENPESRSFSGRRLSKNKSTMVGKGSLKQPAIDNTTAERYGLWISPTLSDKERRETLEPLFMLFLGISQTF